MRALGPGPGWGPVMPAGREREQAPGWERAPVMEREPAQGLELEPGWGPVTVRGPAQEQALEPGRGQALEREPGLGQGHRRRLIRGRGRRRGLPGR